MNGIEALVSAIENETDGINELLGLIIQQRDAVRDGNFEAMQDVMKLLHSVSLKVRKCEALRDQAAGSLAASLGCEAKLSSLCEATKDEALSAAGSALMKASNTASAESKILRRLIEEGQKFNDMMLSEMRRFDSSGGFARASGSMDIKG